jgi:hypothetical protein
MLKKMITAVAFCLVLACGQAFAADAAADAQQEQAIAAAMAAMANQPPLTQADIDAFIELSPKMAAAANDQAAVLKLVQESGIAPERLGLISTKISIGFALAQGMTREQMSANGQVPEFMFPSDAETALIKENTNAIMQAMMGAQ